MRRALVLGLALLLPACSAATISPERQALLRQKGEECRREGVVSEDYRIDQFGQVIVTGRSGHAGVQGQANRLAACIKQKMGGTQVAPVAPVSPTISPVSVSPPSRTADRLQELDALRSQRLITEEEYQATRKRILEGL